MHLEVDVDVHEHLGNVAVAKEPEVQHDHKTILEEKEEERDYVPR